MPIGKFIRGWWDANREYFRGRKSRKAVRQSNVPPEELHAHVHRNASPVFVLSPGRSGTKTLTELFGEHSSIDVYHMPEPELTYHSRVAYEWQNEAFETLKTGVDMARYEVIRASHMSGRTYIETNNRITFFAPCLADLFPNSKFIHLIRAPEDFIRSGVARGYYSGTSLHDEGRIRPLGIGDEKWKGFSEIEKVAFLWNETHEFIESFKKRSGLEGRVCVVRAEDLFQGGDAVEQLFTFSGLSPIPAKKVRKVLRTPVNQQKVEPGTFDKKEWEEVRHLVPLRQKYYGEEG